MTSVGLQLVRTIRSASRVIAVLPRQLMAPDISLSFSPSFSTSTRTFDKENEPKIESLEDLENLLNVPTYGNRGEEFDKALKLEYDFFKYNGQLVPDVMTDDMWEEIRTLRTVEDRLELYRFLQLRERHKNRHLSRTRKGDYADKRRRALLAEKLGGEDKVPEDIYDEKGYSMLGPTVSVTRKIDENIVKKLHNQNLPYALNFGQPLVFDMGVDYQMSNYEGSNFISQMKELYGSNRAHFEPFNLYLCNYNPRNVVQRKLVEGNHTEKWLWNVTRRCFTEIFPKEKIVYLTSRSRVALREFSHDSVYVIGATVDKRPGKDEMSKVKELGLNHAYFDLNPVFSRKGKSNIPLNQVFRALMDQRDTSNLPWAYRHFTRRRFTYRERAMNRIVIEQEQLFVNKRSIMAPPVHDISQYELRPEREYDEEMEESWEETPRRRRTQYDDDVDDEEAKKDRYSARWGPRVEAYRRYRDEEEEENAPEPTYEELTQNPRNTFHNY